jgi:hypothetical protein
MNRFVLRALKGVSIMGLVGSAGAFVAAAFSRNGMFVQAVRAGRPMDGIEIVFSQVVDSLLVLFLAGLLYAAADIALRLPPPLRPRHDDHD